MLIIKLLLSILSLYRVPLYGSTMAYLPNPFKWRDIQVVSNLLLLFQA